jgi:hypothetical protein
MSTNRQTARVVTFTATAALGAAITTVGLVNLGITLVTSGRWPKR